MDSITLNKEYQKICASNGIYPKGEVRAFALVNRNSLYCSEDNERVCGQELMNLLRAEMRNGRRHEVASGPREVRRGEN